MKTRNGFVSNSSSCSFTIDLNKISVTQRYQIENHIYFANKEFGWYMDRDDAWSIYEKGRKFLELSTFMDNFDMKRFLQYINVSEDAIVGNNSY